MYDDGDEGDSTFKKPKRRRPRPIKEKDLVTMVSGMQSSDEEDAGKEVDLDVEEDDGRNSSLSSGNILIFIVTVCETLSPQNFICLVW